MENKKNGHGSVHMFKHKIIGAIPMVDKKLLKGQKKNSGRFKLPQSLISGSATSTKNVYRPRGAKEDSTGLRGLNLEGGE